MKTMALTDLTLMRRDAKSFLFTALFVVIVVGVSGTSLGAIAAMLAAMVTLLLGFALIGADEQNGWERMRCTLPLRRRDVISGRYASIAIAGLVVTAASIVLTLAAGGIFGTLPWIETQTFNSELIIETVVAAILGLCICLIYLGIMLPITAKYGLTKGVRYFPLIFVLFFILAFTVAPDSVSGIVESLGSLPFAGVVIGVVVVSIVFYLASMTIAIKLYETREF